MIWSAAMTRINEGWDAFVAANPDLAATVIVPGAEVAFTIDAGELGPLQVTVHVPIPLLPTSGTVSVSFKDVTATEVALPPQVIALSQALEHEISRTLVGQSIQIVLAQAVESESVLDITPGIGGIGDVEP